jgi:hypothetical protein
MTHPANWFPCPPALAVAQPHLRIVASCARESPPGTHIDGPRDSVYICIVPARKIQVGEVWKKDSTGESYLITKVYNEALATYAMLRKAGAENERAEKVKVDHRGPTNLLPGFSYTQEADEF